MTFLDNNDAGDFQVQPAAHVRAGFKARTTNADPGYAMEAGRGFDALKYALSLMTGTLLLDLVKADRTVVDRALGENALDAIAVARDALSACAPRDLAGQHHLHHLQRALEHVEDAAEWGVRQANLIDANYTDMYCASIRAAWDELKKLDALMTGFGMVDLSQSCCAFHDRLAAQLARA